MAHGPTGEKQSPVGAWRRSRRTGATTRRHRSLVRSSPPRGRSPRSHWGRATSRGQSTLEARPRSRPSLARGPRASPRRSPPRGLAHRFFQERAKPRRAEALRPLSATGPRASTASIRPCDRPRRCFATLAARRLLNRHRPSAVPATARHAPSPARRTPSGRRSPAPQAAQCSQPHDRLGRREAAAFAGPSHTAQRQARHLLRRSHSASEWTHFSGPTLIFKAASPR